MKKKIISIFLLVVLIAVVIPAAETLDVSDVKERNSTDDIQTIIPDNNPAIGNINKAWTVVEVHSIPESASGLAYDGTNLYCGIYGADGDEVYQIDPNTGSYSLLFSGPQGDAFGLTYDGTYLWTTDHPGSSSTPAIAMQLDMSGNLISQFDLPAHYMSGIAYDNGDFWVAAYYDPDGQIYKVDDQGDVITEFSAPDNQPWDLCLENNNLWMVDYWGDAIYKIDPSDGSLLETHDSEGTDPAGIVWDGSYLWYCDNGQGGVDYLYKIDLNGSGTPEIYVPSTNYDFGPVVVGSTETWNATVENVGIGDLVINDVTFTGIGSSDLSCSLTFPITIGPGNQSEIPIAYEPLAIGLLNAIATIESNDPINPEVEITLTGNGVTAVQDIYLPEDTYDYGLIRKLASKRWQMEIQNVGNNILTINSITSDDTNFYVDAQVTFPINLDVLESIEVGIWFQPGSGGGYSGTLTITNNDPDENPYYVTVQGTGIETNYPITTTLWEYDIASSINNRPKTIDSIPEVSTRILREATGSIDRQDHSPKAIASIPDISDDGWNDVIVCSEDDYVRCLNGGASGTSQILWEHEIYAGSVYSQNDLVINEDVDTDGYNDVVVGSCWGGRLIRTVSGKTGEEIWTHDTHEYGSGGWVYQVDCSYDYNGDGVTDVLAATGDDSTDTGPKRVYCLDALTGSSIWECPLGGPGFSVIGIEDFTGDGQPDVLAGASNEAETIGYAYGINGQTGSISWTFTAAGTSVWAVEQVDDITSDGIKDVIIGDFSGNIYGLDATTGGEIYSNSLGTGVITLRFENIDDVNDDGHSDILPAHSGTIARVIDGYTGSFIWSQSLVDKSWCVAGSSDISGDGINDVFIGTLYTNNKCYFFNGTDGSELGSKGVHEPVDAIAAIPDIVGDASMEMIVGCRDGYMFCFSGGVNVNPENPDVLVTELQTGWNFVSLPFNQSIDLVDLTVNYSGTDYNWTDATSVPIVDPNVYGWDRSLDMYVPATTMEPGYGYWIYAYFDCELWVENISATPDDFITDLKMGWNTMGVPSDQPVDLVNLTVNYGGTDYTWTAATGIPIVDPNVYGWDRILHMYVPVADTLEPGYSYWMYAYQNCTLRRS